MEFKSLELVRVASPPSRINRIIMEFKYDPHFLSNKIYIELIES